MNTVLNDKIMTEYLLQNAKIEFTPEIEDMPISDSFSEPEDIAWVTEQYNNVTPAAWFLAKVTATFAGQTGTAYLGGCSYESFEQFLTDDYYQQLKYEAVEDLKQQLDAMTQEINKMKEAVCQTNK